MNRNRIAAVALVAITIGVVGSAACSSDKSPTSAPTSSPAITTPVSPYGGDPVGDLGAKIHRENAVAIVETVEQRGGTPEQAISALLAGEAETGWQSGLSMAPPSVDIRDIYGWRLRYNIAADSTDVVRAATDAFMDTASTLAIDTGDPAAYALAVQRADPRGYNENEHFSKRGETAAGEYAAALPKAQAAYADLRGGQ